MIMTILIIGLVFHLSATHIAGAELTYECLGGNDYKITFILYRDCSAGTVPGGTNTNAPTNVTIEFRSASNNQYFNIQFPRVPGTGQEISPVCQQQSSACGSNYFLFGMEEYVYQKTIILSPSSDWVFYWTQCCRNGVIGSIISPSSTKIYIQATLNNLDASCNSSPQFTSKPLAVLSTYQISHYNPGAVDPDGDSLSYEFITPFSFDTASWVTYLPGYSANQPFVSNPPVSINGLTGDIFMRPIQNIFTITALKITEWRTINGVPTIIGTVMRDIQMLAYPWGNNIPEISGINSVATQYDPADTIYYINGCIGSPISFNIYALDMDTLQNLSLSWNNAIPDASFTVYNNISPNPLGAFTWIPDSGYISNNPHCMTVTVKDNACPHLGIQIHSYCFLIDKKGLQVNLGNDTIICNNQSITLNAGPNYNTYQWSDNSTGQTLLVDSSGTGNGTKLIYIEVVDSNGCHSYDTTAITFVTCSNIAETNDQVPIKIYPNPCKGKFFIEKVENSENMIIDVINIMGRNVFYREEISTKSRITIDISNNAKGLYLLRIRTGKYLTVQKITYQ